MRVRRIKEEQWGRGEVEERTEGALIKGRDRLPKVPDNSPVETAPVRRHFLWAGRTPSPQCPPSHSPR